MKKLRIVSSEKGIKVRNYKGYDIYLGHSDIGMSSNFYIYTDRKYREIMEFATEDEAIEWIDDHIGDQSIKASYLQEHPSDYLISCIQDGVIGMESVLSELLHHVSEDDIREVNDALGLYDLDEWNSWI